MLGRTRESSITFGRARESSIMLRRARERYVTPGRTRESSVMLGRIRENSISFGTARESSIMLGRARKTSIMLERARESSTIISYFITKKKQISFNSNLHGHGWKPEIEWCHRNCHSHSHPRPPVLSTHKILHLQPESNPARSPKKPIILKCIPLYFLNEVKYWEITQFPSYLI